MEFLMAIPMVKESSHSDVRILSRIVAQNRDFWSDLGKRERISGTNSPIAIKSTPLDSSGKVGVLKSRNKPLEMNCCIAIHADVWVGKCGMFFFFFFFFAMSQCDIAHWLKRPPGKTPFFFTPLPFFSVVFFDTNLHASNSLIVCCCCCVVFFFS
jgi:hypothetical protein